MASGVFEAPTALEVSTASHKTRKSVGSRARSTLLQELMGIMIVVFGGETFLCKSVADVHSGISRASVPSLSMILYKQSRNL
jgi:hypothetical protein